MPARSLEPDDGQTLAVLLADGNEYVGRNGGPRTGFKNLSPGGANHAEVNALWDLYLDRQQSGISGGTATMYVDRPPCWSYCLTQYGNGDIVKAVDQARLNALEIIYGSGMDVGVMRSSGRATVLSSDFAKSLWDYQ